MKDLKEIKSVGTVGSDLEIKLNKTTDTLKSGIRMLTRISHIHIRILNVFIKMLKPTGRYSVT